MSQPTEEPSNQLSEVINRINALTQQSRFKSAPLQDSIPRLTETYEGGLPLEFIEAAGTHLPILDEVVNGAPLQEHELAASVLTKQSTGPERLSAAQQERLLSEMKPVIKAAVKKAILGELVVIEKALKTTLEQDLLDALKKRIESGQF